MPGSEGRGVIIVADNPDIRLLIRVHLRKDPRFHVLADVGTADEALDLVSAARPDLIVLDDRLGAIAGVDLAGDLVAAAPKAMILLLAAPAGSMTVRSIAVDGLLPKDRLSEITGVVRRLLELPALHDE